MRRRDFIAGAITAGAMRGRGQVALPPFQGSHVAQGGLPSGAWGVWYADQYVSSARKYIPNAVGATTAPVSKWGATRRSFSDQFFWNNSNSVTVTDDAGTAPDSTNEASSVVGTGSSWYIGRTIGSVPSGTYTVAVYVKWLGSSGQAFQIVTPGSSPTFTATSSWQRCAVTFAYSGGSLQIVLESTGTSSSLLICDFELFTGSSDLGPEASPCGLMTVGKSAWDSTSSASGGILDLTASSSFAHIQMPSSVSLGAFTVVSLAQKTGSSTGFVGVLNKPNLAFNTFGAQLEFGIGGQTEPGLGYSGSTTWTPETYTNYWKFLGTGWHTFTHQYDGAQLSFNLDGGQMLYVTGTRSAPSVRDFMVGTIWNADYGQGWKFAAIAIYQRALSRSEIKQAEAALLAHASASGVTRSSGPRVLILEGDSITASSTNYGALVAPNLSPACFGCVFAGPGSSLAAVNARAATLDKAIPLVKPSGSKYITSILIGRNDYGSYTPSDYAVAVAGWTSARKAAGWDKVVLVTILPSTASGFNTWRNSVNAIFKGAGWATANGVDAICDFAADATMGPDAAASDTSLYPDGTHPSTTAQSTYLEPIYRAVINGL